MQTPIAGQCNLQPKLSIVVPCYNTEAYLPRCLDSLIAQTLDGVEIIGVNDGSPDNCLGILTEYKDQYPDIIRVVNKPNGGLWNARWSGTDVATGEYVAYLDSDDYVEPTFAEDLFYTAKREQADIVVCGFKRVEKGTEKVISCEISDKKSAFIPCDSPNRLIEINPAAWNKAFKRSLLDDVCRIANPPAILEDVVLSQLAYLSASGPVAFTGTAPYNYLIREGSMINSVTSEQVDSIKQALLEVQERFIERKASKGMLQELDAIAFLHLGISMAFRLSCNPEADLRRSINETTEFLDVHFPTWCHSPYINLKTAKSGSAYSKLFIAYSFYKWHLMKPFLGAYRFAIEKLHIDIKW